MASSTAFEMSFGGVGGRVGRLSSAEEDEDNIAYPERRTGCISTSPSTLMRSWLTSRVRGRCREHRGPQLPVTRRRRARKVRRALNQPPALVPASPASAANPLASEASHERHFTINCRRIKLSTSWIRASRDGDSCNWSTCGSTENVELPSTQHRAAMSTSTNAPAGRSARSGSLKASQTERQGPGTAEVDRLLLELEQNLESVRISLKRGTTITIKSQAETVLITNYRARSSP